MRTSDYNINGSTVSEVYDLLQPSSDTSLAKHVNGSFILTKPSQNSELKEIKFRRFTPIMKKDLSTLSEQTAEISVTPRFMKSTKAPGKTTWKKETSRDNTGGCALNAKYGEITFPDGKYELALRISGTKLTDDIPLLKGGFDDYIYDFEIQYHPEASVKVRLGFRDDSISIISHRNFPNTNINMTCAKANRVMGKDAWRYVTPAESYGRFAFLITFKQDETLPQGFVVADFGIYYYDMAHKDDESLYILEYMNPDDLIKNNPANPFLITPTKVFIWGRDECDNYYVCNTLSAKKTFEYKSCMLALDESRCSAFTYANETLLLIKPSVLKTKLIGTPNEICANINEKLAGYFSNFKPSSSIHITDADFNTWVLTQYVDDPIQYATSSGYNYDATGMKINDYYKWANMILTERESSELHNPDLVGQYAQVVPQCYFTRIYSQIEKAKMPSDTFEHTLANTIFGVHNMTFCCRRFTSTINELTNSNASAECLWLYFDVDIHCDTDIFNISKDRMWHNTYERIKDNAWSNKMSCFINYNQCISTNEDTIRNLIYANYLAHGLDIVLKCPLMNNISNIVFVNETESQVIMKHTQQFSTSNCINVYVTDIDGKTIDIEYLKRIYRSIMLEIDYVYG